MRRSIGGAGLRSGRPAGSAGEMNAVVVTKLDRIVSHQLSPSDTKPQPSTDTGRLVLAIMGGIAEFERELIRKRCQAGIERAKAKGTKFGRPAALDASQRRKIAERYAAGDTMAELARDYECGDATIWRALQG